MTTTFTSFGLRPELEASLTKQGFTTPTPVQAESIPYVLKNQNDLIALARTGTGKTAAFALPILEKLDTASSQIQALVICPTRELCLQIAADIKEFASEMKNVKIATVFGGASSGLQIRDIKRGAQIIVGTPGRLLDLLERGVFNFSQMQWLVLDEADEMLNMGFLPDINSILAATPTTKQILLFSATMPSDVRRIADRYMKSPHEIKIAVTEEQRSQINHTYFLVHARDRFEVLRRLIDSHPDMYGIVFCSTKRETQEVADQLMQFGYNTDVLHGDISQDQRTSVMKSFKDKHIQILVATDVAARGIDVEKLTHVIHYGVPEKIESYIHRSGRTGRAGESGNSYLILHLKEKGKLKMLERTIGQPFVEGKLPRGEDICKSQLAFFMQKLLTITPNDEMISPFIAQLPEGFEQMDRDTLLKKILTYEFVKFFEHYSKAPDIQVLNTAYGPSSPSSGGGRYERGPRDRGPRDFGSKGDLATIKIQKGRRDEFKPKDVFDYVRSVTNRRDVEIGRILIRDDYTTVEVDQGVAHLFPASHAPERSFDRGGDRRPPSRGGHSSRRDGASSRPSLGRSSGGYGGGGGSRSRKDLPEDLF